MNLFREEQTLPAHGRGLHRIDAVIAGVIARSKVSRGLVSIFVQHTSASIVIQENADPSVLRDLERGIEKLAPEDFDWEHDDEGPDDMPAHLRTALGHTSETIPVEDGKMMLGTWQGVYLWEHRTHARARTIVVTLIGE